MPLNNDYSKLAERLNSNIYVNYTVYFIYVYQGP